MFCCLTIKHAVSNSPTRSIGQASGAVPYERCTVAAAETGVADVSTAKLIVIARFDVTTMILIVIGQAVVHKYRTLTIHHKIYHQLELTDCTDTGLKLGEGIPGDLSSPTSSLRFPTSNVRSLTSDVRSPATCNNDPRH